MTRPAKSENLEAQTEKATTGQTAADPATNDVANISDNASSASPKEFGGQKGPEPTRYGDWEKNGRCTDF